MNREAMTALAIIPARGGSKGIPRKNLASCGGRPLLDWVLKASSESRRLTHRVLSSDDEEILDRGRRFFGVSGLRRPDELATDEATTESAMAHAIEAVGKTDLIVLLQPTSPLTEAWNIDEAIDLIERTGADSVVSVVRSHVFLWEARGGAWVPQYSERQRRQDMPTQFEENGAIYVTTREQWERSGCRLGGRVELYEMDEAHRFQVDSPADLELASVLLSKRRVSRSEVLVGSL